MADEKDTLITNVELPVQNSNPRSGGLRPATADERAKGSPPPPVQIPEIASSTATTTDQAASSTDSVSDSSTTINEESSEESTESAEESS